ncbi:nuclear transport factor 2 family protein [Leptospira sp. GIMC2001]|uniref:nuclear transport factor 2 family protein n=1 Tax=Leptospira sp. GIMC2001 TaxID=1513297 RepID=UPI00234ADA5B|nr:nuclear transport factor 2 family protein [Leptospira sp. GIMC2001]WCL50449.1 nuclear transport factor 2 family protein [Leptospira sp. GIMC2001]
MNILNTITENEDQLIIAMKLGNVSALDKLIHKDLVFTIPNGQTVTKEMDLENYRKGLFKIKEITLKDRKITIVDNIAIVISVIHLEASYGAHEINGNFSYMRIWKEFDQNWQIIAGSSVEIIE